MGLLSFEKLSSQCNGPKIVEILLAKVNKFPFSKSNNITIVSLKIF